MAEPHDDDSQFEAIVRRASPRFTKSHAAKHVLSPFKINMPLVVVPKPKLPSESSDPNLPPPKSPVPPSDPSPVADPPPPPLLDASEPNLTPPNNLETPANVPLPNPAPALKPPSSGKSRAKRKSSSMMPPLRRSSRLKKDVPNPTESVPNPESVSLIHPMPNPKSVPSLNPELVKNPTELVPNPESVTNPELVPHLGLVPTPEEVPNPPESVSITPESVPSTNVSLPHQVSEQTTPLRRSSRLNTPITDSQDVPADIGTPSDPESLLQSEAGDSDWSHSWGHPANHEQRETEPSESTGDAEEETMHPAIKDDDGSKRGVIRRPLMFCDAALGLNHLELDKDNDGAEGEASRKRKRRQKSDVRRGRGKAKPRKPAAPECRPKLMVVGDAEFTSYPICTKVVTTIRILTLENMPGPYRTYNMFPLKARLEILKLFLQRYSWGEEEDEKQCIAVFEKIASEAHYREMTILRKNYDKKYGKDKLVWKDYPPQWCKNQEYWKGLCLIWSKEKWGKISETNKDNKTRDGMIINHVAGSRSMFRHAVKLVSEKGSAVTLKEVFDRTHSKKMKDGKVYVNKRAHDSVNEYDYLKALFGQTMTDEELWELALDGEDSRGRLFGFGYRSRTCKVNQALAAEDATMSDTAKSTATSAEDATQTFTKSQVEEIVASKVASRVAVERKLFAKEIAEQEKRHQAATEEYRRNNSWNQACIAQLYQVVGAPRPTCPEALLSKGNDAGVANREGNDAGVANREGNDAGVSKGN